MRFGIDVSQHQLSWDQLVSRVRFAEEAGFEGAWVFDHFRALYGDPRGPCMEAWTLLAALAASTSRIRLGTAVTGVTYRHPSVLAAEVATVDNVSGGRLELGIGAAWFENEHRELGIPFPPARQRAERLEEAVQVIKGLLTADDVSFTGRHYQLRHAAYHPRPVQQPHPPVWIGAGGPRLTLPIVGRHADAWHAFGSVPDLRRKWAVVAEHAARADRDPDKILRASQLSLSEPWDEVRRRVEELAGAGFGYLIASWPAEGRSRVEQFCERLLPELGATEAA